MRRQRVCRQQRTAESFDEGYWVGRSRFGVRSPKIRVRLSNGCQAIGYWRLLEQNQATEGRLNNRRKARKPVIPMPRRAIEFGSGVVTPAAETFSVVLAPLMVEL
jgi:hypothetical protein